MNPETDDQRNSRIRDAQMQARNSTAPRKTPSSNIQKRPVSNKSANKPAPPTAPRTGKSLMETLSDLLPIAAGGARDVLVGLICGLIPALLILILLPGVFKLLALLVMVGAGVVGYLLGDATPQPK